MAGVELDHVSLVVPCALDEACERWGWRLSVGSGPEHGRVHFDHRYRELRRGNRLEVVAVFFSSSNDKAQALTQRGLCLGARRPTAVTTASGRTASSMAWSRTR